MSIVSKNVIKRCCVAISPHDEVWLNLPPVRWSSSQWNGDGYPWFEQWSSWAGNPRPQAATWVVVRFPMSCYSTESSHLELRESRSWDDLRSTLSHESVRVIPTTAAGNSLSYCPQLLNMADGIGYDSGCRHGAMYLYVSVWKYICKYSHMCVHFTYYVRMPLTICNQY